MPSTFAGLCTGSIGAGPLESVGRGGTVTVTLGLVVCVVLWGFVITTSLYANVVKMILISSTAISMIADGFLSVCKNFTDISLCILMMLLRVDIA
jgi:hypothetical protein